MPHSIFGEEEGWRENVLSIRLQPNEGMTLSVMIKEPGPGGMRLTEVPLEIYLAMLSADVAVDSFDAEEAALAAALPKSRKRRAR